MFPGAYPPIDVLQDCGPIPDDGQALDIQNGAGGRLGGRSTLGRMLHDLELRGRRLTYRLAKMRLASSKVSLDPMSYQMPGTAQVSTGMRG